MLYFFIYKEESVVMKKLFIPKKKDLLISLFLGIFVFSVVMIAYFIFRNYIDFMLSLPWNNTTTDIEDFKLIRENLDKKHYDLNEVKLRIIEYLYG